MIVALVACRTMIMANTGFNAINVSNALEVAADWCFSWKETVCSEEVERVFSVFTVTVLDTFLLLANSIVASTASVLAASVFLAMLSRSVVLLAVAMTSTFKDLAFILDTKSIVGAVIFILTADFFTCVRLSITTMLSWTMIVTGAINWLANISILVVTDMFIVTVFAMSAINWRTYIPLARLVYSAIEVFVCAMIVFSTVNTCANLFFCNVIEITDMFVLSHCFTITTCSTKIFPILFG